MNNLLLSLSLDEKIHDNSNFNLCDFELKSRLGRGSFGEVWKINIPIVKGEMAMKILEIPRADKFPFNEITIMRNIRAPYLLSSPALCNLLLDIEDCNNSNDVTNDNQCYQDGVGILMGLGHGTLTNYIRSRNNSDPIKLHPHAIKRVLLHILKGISVLNTFNFIHLDLKPANILIINETKMHSNLYPEITISDFGASKLIFNKSKIYTPAYRVGSYAYSAPETLHQRRYSILSDIWAIGIMTLELILGEQFGPRDNKDDFDKFQGQNLGISKRKTIENIINDNYLPLTNRDEADLMIDIIDTMLSPVNLRKSAIVLLEHPIFKPMNKTLIFESRIINPIFYDYSHDIAKRELIIVYRLFEINKDISLVTWLYIADLVRRLTNQLILHNEPIDDDQINKIIIFCSYAVRSVLLVNDVYKISSQFTPIDNADITTLFEKYSRVIQYYYIDISLFGLARTVYDQIMFLIAMFSPDYFKFRTKIPDLFNKSEMLLPIKGIIPTIDRVTLNDIIVLTENSNINYLDVNWDQKIIDELNIEEK